MNSSKYIMFRGAIYVSAAMPIHYELDQGLIDVLSYELGRYPDWADDLKWQAADASMGDASPLTEEEQNKLNKYEEDMKRNLAARLVGKTARDKHNTLYQIRQIKWELAKNDHRLGHPSVDVKTFAELVKAKGLVN
jgi:hypothetical protein